MPDVIACPRVVGATEDGKGLVTCGRALPCSRHAAGPSAVGPAESEWQQQVIDLAQLLGWNHLHVRRSIGKKKQWTTSTNRKGWPDLFLWHPRHGCAAIELKAGKNQPTPEQLEVLTELAAAGVTTLVAWPADIDDVAAVLRGQPHTAGAAS